MKIKTLLASCVVLTVCTILPFVSSASREAQPLPISPAQVRVKTSVDSSWLRLNAATEVKVERQPGLQSDGALAFASADFDEDGVSDLVTGYFAEGHGVVLLQRGNIDSLFPNSPEALARRKNGTFSDSPFFADNRSYAVPARTDFIGAGDFDADGHWDVATAARGDNRLWFLRGDGNGGFLKPERLVLNGRVTTLVTGEINRRDGLTDIIIAVDGEDHLSKLLVFESAEGALRSSPETLSLPASATSAALGELDDSFEQDIVVAAGNQLVLIQGRDRRTSLDEASRAGVEEARLSRMTFANSLLSVSIGDFTGDHREEVAALESDGSVRLIERIESGTDFSEAKQNNATGTLSGWRVNEVATVALPFSTSVVQRSHRSRIIKAKVSSLAKDDLVVIDEADQRLHLFTSEPKSTEVAPDEPVTLSDRRLLTASIQVATMPNAVLPMRLGDSALQSLVVSSGEFLSVLSPAVGATVIVNSNLVTNTRDAVLTLNEAIRITNGTLLVSALTAQEQAQVTGTPANPGLDAIQFNIPGSGVPTITDSLLIPAISDSVILNGTTQPAGKVALDSPGGQAALRITAGNSTVRGMVINRSCRGIQLATNGNNIIEGNQIGTSIDGLSGVGTLCSQIEINDSTNNRIGGTTAQARNILSGSLQLNNNSGINISGPNATGNLVQGNYIGTDITGNAVIGNRSHGIFIALNSNINNTIGGASAGAGNVISGNGRDTIGSDSAIRIQAPDQLVQGNIIGLNKDGTAALASSSSGVSVNSVANITIGGTTPAGRNVISGNGTGGTVSHGVVLNGAATVNCLIQGNYIGTNATGTAAVRNLGHGVALQGVLNNTIGGSVAGSRNIISGNILDGVHLLHVALITQTGNQVQGNYIGTDVTGTLAVGNQSDGVEIGVNTGGIGMLIGGTTPSRRNVISGNRENGIHLNTQAKANPNRIEGNYIGTNAFGTGGVPNGQAGIFFVGNDDGQHIGASAAGAANVIAFNALGGLVSDTGRVIGGPVFANSIFSNSGLGIDKEMNGVTANATNRSDNTPVLTSVNTSAGTTTIIGTLQENHTNSVNYTVRFFSNVSCDPSGFGEGQTFIGETTVNVTNNNPVNFTANITPAVPGGRYITAVAIGPATFDPTGTPLSSEFSFCLQNKGSAPPDQTALRVLAIAPNHGGNIGAVTSTITGEGIRQGATVALRKNGESDLAGSSVTIVTEGTSMKGVFDLTGRATGVWDVVITNPDTTSVTLAAAFTIETGRPAEVWTDIVGRAKVAVFPPHDERYFVLYGNRGNVDADATMVRVYVPQEMEIRSVESISGSQPVIGRMDDGGGTFTSGKFIQFYLPTVSADSSGALQLLLRPRQINRTTFNLQVWGYSAPALEAVTSTAPDPSVKITTDVLENTETTLRIVLHVASSTGGGDLNFEVTREDAPGPQSPVIEFNEMGENFEFRAEVTVPANELQPTGNGFASDYHSKAQQPQGQWIRLIKTGRGLKDTYDKAKKAKDNVQGTMQAISDLDLVACLEQNNALDDALCTNRLKTAAKGAIAAYIADSAVDFVPGVAGRAGGLMVSAVSGFLQGAFPIVLGNCICAQGGTGNNPNSPFYSACLARQDGIANRDPDKIKVANESLTLRLIQLCAPCTNGSQSNVASGQTPQVCRPPRPFRRDRPVDIVASIDPNDKVGSAGTTDQHYIRGVEPFRYEIMFENLATATAAAKQVVITDALDISKLDLDTFELGSATFGNKVLTPPAPGLKEWSTDLDLRPARNCILRLIAELDRTTGVVTWRLIALDPATGQISTAPDGGFLPPNVNQPEGSGAVFFTIKPKSNLADGTQVRNHARIVFDANAPIDTADWLNTIDNTLPTSQVQSLAPTQPSTNFTVNWSGTDAGSGNAGVTIFVSENGGPFNMWLDSVLTSSAVYPGRPDTTYGFHSIMRDGAGNQELPKSAAEATTHTPAVTPGVTSIQFSASNYSVNENGLSATITVNRTGDITGISSVDFASSDTAGSNLCNVNNGAASSRCDYITARGQLTFAQNETQKTFVVLVSDDAYADGSETLSVALSNPVGGSLGASSTATVTINDNDVTNGANPIEVASFFVRQHYLDFLNREPDAGGLNFWTNEITSCGANAQCVEVKRINVSAAFFLSIEFQETGYLVYRMYKSGLGNLPGAPVSVRFSEFLRDTQQMGLGVQVGVGNWQQQLEANKQAYALQFVQRPEFVAAFPNTMTGSQIVAQMNTNMGGVLTSAEQSNLIAMFNGTPSDINKRAAVLRAAAETNSLRTAEFNKAFVLMQYFGYLRRNPNDLPDSDFSGFDFWLGKLNSFGGNFVNAEMVKAFITSIEYRQRFAP